MDKTAVADALKQARELMNDSGAHWTQGNWKTFNEEGEWAYCSVGALREVLGYVPFATFDPTAKATLSEATSILAEDDEVIEAAKAAYNETTFQMAPPMDRVIVWNDEEGRTWEQISALFERAEARARGASA